MVAWNVHTWMLQHSAISVPSVRSQPEAAVTEADIPIQRPFIGLDIMNLPCTEQGNRRVVVFHDIFTKWPFVFPVPNQKTERIVKLLCNEIVPLFGIPEALLTDRGTNLLSHLTLDIPLLTTLSVTAWWNDLSKVNAIQKSCPVWSPMGCAFVYNFVGLPKYATR